MHRGAAGLHQIVINGADIADHLELLLIFEFQDILPGAHILVFFDVFVGDDAVERGVDYRIVQIFPGDDEVSLRLLELGFGIDDGGLGVVDVGFGFFVIGLVGLQFALAGGF